MNSPQAKFAIFRRSILLLIYSFGLSFSLWLAYSFRFDFNIDAVYMAQFWMMLIWIVPLKLISLYIFRQYEAFLSYFSVPDLVRLFYAIASAFLFTVILWFSSGGGFAPPRSVILADFVLSLMGLAGARLSFRLVRERYFAPHNREQRRARRVGIIGAGDVGASLARELSAKRGLGLQPVFFFDDDRSKWGSRVHNIPVVGSPEKLLEKGLDLNLEEIIIAMPTAPVKRIGEVVKILQQARLKFETVPSIDQLAMGKVKVSQLRSVEIQDLLGRESVKLETEDIRHILRSKIVMVTGAGGSIGSELCRQIANFNPTTLLMVEQSEVQLFQVEQEMISLGHRAVVVPLIADISDFQRMEFLFERYKPRVVFHSAAHKHVPMMESQPGEAIKNNSFGTAKLAELSLRFDVERFVLISTDKAINPTNVMGASKRLAEMFIQALHASAPDRTKFMAVRFGNVLGSSGSVIPIFNKQIAAGGPVKITHPDVTRYFMTIPEAVGLVLQSGAQGQGGEIFVLDMGRPVKIVDLARQLIELSGLRPDEDIEIEFVGLRPGEKLFEELSHKGENISSTHHEKIMRFVCKPESIDKLRKDFQDLQNLLDETEGNDLKRQLKRLIPEYHPFFG